MNPLLRMAVLAGADKAVSLHINREPDLNSSDENGMTLLMHAAVRGHSETCRVLLEAGADPFKKNGEGKSAECLAGAYGHSEAEKIITSYLRRVFQPQAAVELATIADHFESQPENATKHQETLKDLENDDWEEDFEPKTPDTDLSLLKGADDLQLLMASHRPLDLDEDWVDIEIELPDFSWFSKTYLLHEFLETERRFFLHGIFSGRMTYRQLLDMAEMAGDDSQQYFENLQEVLHDLGVRIDDLSSDYIHPLALDELDIPDEDPASQITDEAIRLLWEKNDPLHDPYWIYVRDIRKIPLLTADEEISLARKAEEAKRDILQSIILFPPAIKKLKEMLRLDAGNVLIFFEENHEETYSPEDDLIAEHDIVSGSDPEQESRMGNEQKDVGQLRLLIDDLLDSEIFNHRSEASIQQQILVIEEKLAGFKLSSEALYKLSDGIEQYRVLSQQDDFEYKTGISATYFIDVSGRLENAVKRLRYANKRMILSNLRLAHHLATKYQRSGMAISDLIQEANIGLLKAVERFDYRRGFRFSTFATWWIRQAITRGIADKVRNIRIPVHIFEGLSKVRRAIKELETGAREAAAEDIADVTNLPLDKVLKLLRIPEDPLSLDELEEEKPGLTDSLFHKDEDSPEAETVQAGCSEVIARVLSTLTAKEEKIIRLRFGVGEDKPFTLEEVGRVFGVTRERIRQIEGKALRKLRHPARSKKLRPFYL